MIICNKSILIALAIGFLLAATIGVSSVIAAPLELEQVPLFLVNIDDNDRCPALPNELINSNGRTATSNPFDNDSNVYSGMFNPITWSGDVVAAARSQPGSLTETWRAAEKLDRAGRNIISYNGKHGIPFAWSWLNNTQKGYLGNQAVLDYLRGDRDNEGKLFRTRDGILGDIINSAPVFVGAPGMRYPDIDPYGNKNNRYSQYWNQHNQRAPMVYVGANDGMLHGFNANTGEELLAYVPYSVTANLASLSDSAYTHRYFVDQTPTVSDAYFADNNQWRTILASGLGAGGRGVFALDITDPGNFSEPRANQLVLWEFTAADDTNNRTSDLGYTLARPVIALTHAKRNGNGPNRWAAIVGNGYNSDSGIAKLLVLFLDADPSDGWDYGDDYVEISTETGSPDHMNGLSSPAVIDSDSDGIMDRAYAGDLHGNLWAFDLSGNDAERWKSVYGDSTNPKPLFVARNHHSDRQPITAKPAVAHHPSQPGTKQNAPNLMIYFGTGQYLTRDDLTDRRTQTFYGVWDNGLGGLSRNQLKAQTIDTSDVQGEHGSSKARLTKDIYAGYDAEQPSYGWYIDLDSATASSGERVVSNAVVRRDVVYFTTFTPNVDKCGRGGSSWFMFVRTDNGDPPSVELVDINRNRKIGQDDRVKDIPASGVQIPNEGTQLGGRTGLGGATLTPDEAIFDQNTSIKMNLRATQKGQRLSWRELRRN